MKSERLMVLRSDRLGDIVLCSGYLAALRESLPEAEIDLWLAPDMVSTRSVLHPGLNVLTLPFDRYLSCEDTVLERWIREVSDRAYDTLVVPQFTLGFPEVTALSFLTIPVRWGFQNFELGFLPDWVHARLGEPLNALHKWITAGPSVPPYSHETDKYRELASSQTLACSSMSPRLYVQEIFGEDTGKAVIWPGSAAEARRWPANNFADVAQKLELTEVAIGITERERTVGEELMEHLSIRGIGACLRVCDPARLAETARWLASAKLVLTNDTGIAHLTAAVGGTVVAVSGSQHQGRFNVSGTSALTIFADVPCRRCDGACIFNETVQPCVSRIDAQSVAAAIRSFQGGRDSRFVQVDWFNDRATLFAEIVSARRQSIAASDRLRLDLTQSINKIKSSLNESESQRNAWERLCHESEAQISNWQKSCHEAEDQRNRWEALCHQAEDHRALWQSGYAQAELELQRIRSQYEHVDRRLEEFYRIFPWARDRSLQEQREDFPRISVVTPSFQQGNYIAQTIQSVLDQQYPDFEHIIVDAGSTDATIEVLKQYPHLKWVSEPDKGQAHAINKGMMMATGDIVAYLNSDDVYRPGAFHAVAQAFRETPEARILVGNCDYIDETSAVTGHLKARYEKLEDLIRYWGWDKWYCIPQPSAFLKRDLLAEVGLLDTRLHMAMDYDMWLRVAQVADIHICDKTLAAFRLASSTKTVSRTDQMYYEEFETSSRRWKLLPLRRRVPVALGAHRHLARKLLAVAEHLAFHEHNAALAGTLLSGAARKWPSLALNPRFVLTALQLATGRFPEFRAGTRIAHRAYLSLLWRMHNR